MGSPENAPGSGDVPGVCAGVWGPETAELGVLPVTWLAPKGCWDSAARLGLGEGAMFQGAEAPAYTWPHLRRRDSLCLLWTFSLLSDQQHETLLTQCGN